MEYVAFIIIMLSLVDVLVLLVLFRNKWKTRDMYPHIVATMVDHILYFKCLY